MPSSPPPPPTPFQSLNSQAPYLILHSCPTESPEKNLEKRKRKEENKVLDELVSDISRDETDHLDLEMVEERQFLDDYLARLSSLQ